MEDCFVAAWALLISFPRDSSRFVLPGNFEDGGFYGFEDLEVAGAAAEIAGESFADLIACGMRILVEQGFCGDKDGGRAVTALRGAEIGEGLLQGMQLAVGAEAFYGQDFFSLAFEGEEQAGENWFAIEEDGAGAALSEFAAVFGAGVVEVFAEDFEQGFVGSEGDVRLLAV